MDITHPKEHIIRRLNGNMCDKYLYARKTINTDECEKFEVEYYIIKTSPDNYGVEIVKHQFDGGLLYTEIKSVENLCPTECSVMLLLRIISDYTVTPMGLSDIIDDMRSDPRFYDIFSKNLQKVM